MTPPGPGGWPLSAASTAVLREPGLGRDRVLKLALRELVVRGVLVADLGEPRRFRRRRLTLRPGSAAATGLPVPLQRLADELLPHVGAAGSEATEVVQACVGSRQELLEQLRTDVRDALQDRGLLTAERTRVLGVVPRTRWVRTPTGEAWAAVPRGLERDRGSALAAGAPTVGLLLALDDDVARALREEGDATLLVDTGGDVDDRTLDEVLGDVGAGLDGAVDGGSGSSGDGGDGGGGD